MNNYEKIKSMSLYQLARLLEKTVSLPFEVSILNKRERIQYCKLWLLADSKND